MKLPLAKKVPTTASVRYLDLHAIHHLLRHILHGRIGLRREENIKIQPGWADQGDILVLKASWTKSGKERKMPIRTGVQRQLLDHAKALASAGEGTCQPDPGQQVLQGLVQPLQGSDRVRRHRPRPRLPARLCPTLN